MTTGEWFIILFLGGYALLGLGLWLDDGGESDDEPDFRGYVGDEW